MKEDNAEIIKQIKDDAAFEKEDITSKNENNKTSVHEISLKSKAELQLFKNRVGDLEMENDKLERESKEKKEQLDKQKNRINELNNEINKQTQEIKLKDSEIGEKERRIY